MASTRAVIRQTETLCEQASAAPRRLRAAIDPVLARLQQMLPLVRRVVVQTRARILHGNTHYPDKLMSLFEPHTEAIRKGKAAKPTEVGTVIKLQEAEAQFLTDYRVCAPRVPDQDLWLSSLETHRQLFGRVPPMAVADAGVASRTNERLAQALGVRHVALPPRGRGRPRLPRVRWLRRALRWRTGCEGRISVLKRRHGLRRCRYRGLDGMERWVGLGVIANNLIAMHRGRVGRRPKP